jgi:hypothetical protein
MIMLAMKKSVASIQMLQETFPLVQSLEGTFIVIQRVSVFHGPLKREIHLLTIAPNFQHILALSTNLVMKIVTSVFRDSSSCSPDTVLSSAFCDKNLLTEILDHRHCNPCLLPPNQKSTFPVNLPHSNQLYPNDVICGSYGLPRHL